jgi:nuclear pore complex protein Nup53
LLTTKFRQITTVVVGEDDENWITIFGFPPSSATYFLKVFQEFGDVIRHEMPAGTNWMHLQYETRLQAHKALARNGKVS